MIWYDVIGTLCNGDGDINIHTAADTILQMYCCSLFAPLHSTVFITSLYSISLISVVCGIEPAGLAVADRADLVPDPRIIALQSSQILLQSSCYRPAFHP